jgi:hypothetical protein
MLYSTLGVLVPGNRRELTLNSLPRAVYRISTGIVYSTINNTTTT